MVVFQSGVPNTTPASVLKVVGSVQVVRGEHPEEAMRSLSPCTNMEPGGILTSSNMIADEPVK